MKGRMERVQEKMAWLIRKGREKERHRERKKDVKPRDRRTDMEGVKQRETENEIDRDRQMTTRRTDLTGGR